MTCAPTHRACGPAAQARAALALAVVIAGLGLGGCSAPKPGLAVVGTVRDSVSVVVVPAIGMPSVDLDAGFAAPSVAGPTGSVGSAAQASSSGSRSQAPSPATGTGRGGAPAAVATTGLGSVVRVSSTTVREGTPVVAGQTIAILDDQILAAQVRAARAAVQTAEAQLPVLDDRLAELDDKRAELAAKDRTLAEALATITSTRATMTGNQAQLTANRATATAQRKALAANRATLATQQATLTALLATLPTDPSVPLPPGTPARAQVQAQLAAVAAGLAQADAGLAQLDAGLDQMSAGLAQLTSGLAQLDAKTTQIRTGRAAIADGRAALADARSGLLGVRELARIGADTAHVAVGVAEQQQTLTVVTSPVTGVVVAAARPGDLLAAGAVLATIRPDGPARAVGWIPATGQASECLGARATIHGDWMLPGTELAATVTSIGDRADYPPSSHATDEVHLLRALPIEVTATQGSLPPGVPVDLWLDGCRSGPG